MDSNVMFPMCSPKTSNSFQPAVPSVNNIVNYSSPDFNKNKSVSNKKSHITPPQAVKLSKQDRIFYNRCFSLGWSWIFVLSLKPVVSNWNLCNYGHHCMFCKVWLWTPSIKILKFTYCIYLEWICQVLQNLAHICMTPCRPLALDLVQMICQCL